MQASHTRIVIGEAGTNNCTNLMNQFDGVCERLGVPIANEKTEGPATILEYLGLSTPLEGIYQCNN
jgi:hypothetical protein